MKRKLRKSSSPKTKWAKPEPAFVLPIGSPIPDGWVHVGTVPKYYHGFLRYAAGLVDGPAKIPHGKGQSHGKHGLLFFRQADIDNVIAETDKRRAAREAKKLAQLAAVNVSPAALGEPATAPPALDSTANGRAGQDSQLIASTAALQASLDAATQAVLRLSAVLELLFEQSCDSVPTISVPS